MTDPFTLVGIRAPAPAAPAAKRRTLRGGDIASAVVLALILLGCALIPFFLSQDPAYMELRSASAAPSRAFPFGTDTMGRDIFAMIWSGGRVSLFIGLCSAALSTAIAVLYGALSGCAPDWLDALLMRAVELILCIPSLLLVIFLQALLGKPSVLSLSLVLGLTGWMSIAKVVRSEVRRLRSCDYVLAAKCMGGGFFHVLWTHLLPNFLPSILFMIVMNIRSAIVTESTLSFMGIGLPLEVISWGSMLSLAEKALLTRAWWILILPGVFLITTLLCITNLANALRRRGSARQSSL